SVIRRRRWSPGYDRWMEMVPCQFREVGHWNDITEPTCRVTFIETLEGLRELQPAVSSELPPSLLKSNPIYVHPYDIHALEFFAPQVNKWSALQYLCRRQGIGPDQVVAIGDSVNDLEMIQHAGLSFAVANADDTIRRLANYTAPANDEAGVAWAVNRVLSPPAE
ncbi:MAG: HAD hydrolase family protein, partial [Phycisphaerales bacterium]